jgi:hypothetical protein
MLVEICIGINEKNIKVVLRFCLKQYECSSNEIRPTSPSLLWRLDALTLETLAQREFTGYQGGRLVPAQPSE